MEEKQNSPEEARFWKDKHILETADMNKPTAMAMGVSAENFDKIKGKPEEEKDVETLKQCFEEILNLIGYYIDLPPQNKYIIALWIIGSYLHSSFSAFPYLFLNAMRGSAKTRTLGVISHLAYKAGGKINVGINERVLYRSEQGAALILDECEQVGKKQKEELREYLNAGYKRGITVSRSKKVKQKTESGFEETYIQEEFSPFRPIVMANIWGMEEVLEDRCITLILEKSGKPEFIKIIEDYHENPAFSLIKDRLNAIQCRLCRVVMQKNTIYRWNNYIKNKYLYTLYTQTTETTQTTQTTLEPQNSIKIYHALKAIDSINFEPHSRIFEAIDNVGIDGRNLELFLPLLIVSLLLGEDHFEKTLNYSSEIVSQKRSEELSESKDVSFIEFVAGLSSQRFDYISIKALTFKFREYLGEGNEEDPWLNEKWVGRALKRLNLTTLKRRVARGREVLLAVDHAKEKLKIFKREEE